MPLRILFVPFGSEGDVSPLFWIADALAARGHVPVFLLTPHYRRFAESRGFSWIPMGTEKDFEHFARDPRLWDRLRGPEFVIRGMIETLPAYREAFAKAGRPIDLVVTSSFALAASSLAESEKIPRLTLHFQPVCLRSEFDCPLFLPELAWIKTAPRWVKRVFFRLVDTMLWRLVKKPLNAFRAGLGLQPFQNFYGEALNGAEAVAALFPDWFAPPQPDWPSNLRQFGFPVSPVSRLLPSDLEAYLSTGPAPVVWTHGSANFDIRHFQARALAISQKLDIRCLLVSLDPPEQQLPAGAFHVSHVRFEDLFPRCAAVVHHGGIGTTARCIAAGVPQLIIPRSHDQPDNAHRITTLGLGRSLTYAQLDKPEVIPALRDLLGSDSIKSRCAEFQTRMLAHDFRPALCDWAEQLAARA